ncbi:hypothetical protein [Oceanisphaera ostreae]|uniref:Oxidoreductase molybdopterin-binding domain-containing protein n=1 Tax=Oceanisphaera ostreae TaxID=914151 RepID=A0ABW3KFX2_9GAMM
MRTNLIKERLASRLLCTLALLLSYWVPQAVVAYPLPTAQGRVVLTVTGNITVTNSNEPLRDNGANEVEFDLALLESLPQHEFITKTPWTDGEHHFRGVLLQDLLQRVGAQSTRVKAVALNAYFHHFDSGSPELSSLLVATHFDGKPMKIRDKGPVWLMLPLSEYKELDTKLYYELLLWQLKSLDVGYGEDL